MANMFDDIMKDTMELDKMDILSNGDHSIEDAINELKKRHGVSETTEAANAAAEQLLEKIREKEAVLVAAAEKTKETAVNPVQGKTVDVVQPYTPDLVEVRPEAEQVSGDDAKAGQDESEAPVNEAAEPVVEAETAEPAAEEAVEPEAEPEAEAGAQAESEKVEEPQEEPEAEAEAEVQAEEPEAEEPVEEPAAEVQTEEEPEAQVQTEETQEPVVPAEPAVTAPAVPAASAEEAPSGRPNVVCFGLNPVLPYSMEEAINRLRINISFLGNDVKKIMIVSSEPNEGKSFVAMNLWKQMAVSGEPSLLLDLDMRKSTMAVKYQLEREDGKELLGTTHFLSGNDAIEDVILHTELEHGDILPNVDNIVNPSMLLESRKFGEMMRYMENHYRYVFVDVPPLGLVSDGELIGSVCDGAILCVRGGVTSRGIVRRSIQQLERAGCQVLGIVLNRVGGSGSGYYHKYYGKKYYYNDQYYSGKK